MPGAGHRRDYVAGYINSSHFVERMYLATTEPAHHGETETAGEGEHHH